MYNYANEIIDDIRSEFGDSAIAKFDNKAKQEISEAIAIHNAMTQEERDSIFYLKENNFAELIALRNRVKQRAGI